MNRILIIISILIVLALLAFSRVQNFSSSDETWSSKSDETLEDYLESQFSRWALVPWDNEIIVNSNDGEYAQEVLEVTVLNGMRLSETENGYY